jgi:acid stress-induced BolA-like protein IbaG/YrbA
MDASAVSALVEAGLADCRVDVEGGGGKYQVTVVGEVFDGLSPVKRQQLVYATLTEVIADGSVHAVTIRTFTRAQWSARGA